MKLIRGQAHLRRNTLKFFLIATLIFMSIPSYAFRANIAYWKGVASTAILSLLAGNTDGPGNLNDTGTAANFSSPDDVAVDGSGNVYVADTNNHLIRKITSAGVVTTFAGQSGVIGSTNGTGTAASFNGPTGVAVDSAGNVYVADSFNHLIRIITPAGVVTTLAGQAGVFGSINATGTAASFHEPSSVAVDGSGNVFVADSLNNKIRQITSAGVVTTLAGQGAAGSTNATGTAATFFRPKGVAVDGVGNVYVADYQNKLIRKVTSAGVVTTLAGQTGVIGSANGTGTAATFYFPEGVAVDGSGNVYVADSFNRLIRKITSAGVVTTLAGQVGINGATNGTGTAASFNFPRGLAADTAGNVYVADSDNHLIRHITPAAVVTTFAGQVEVVGSTNATGSAARFNLPRGVAVDGSGNVYVADFQNNLIRKITSAGVVTTLAGQAGVFGAVNGTGTAASFDGPFDVAVDGSGNVYVADSYNHLIRKITPAGVVTTLAGSAGVVGTRDDIGTAAEFFRPSGVAVDSTGNVYVADLYNHLIRKITPAGAVTTLAGQAGITGSTNATGTAASFNEPIGVAVDGSGNVYVADSWNHLIRKVTSAGVVTTLAGQDGVGGATNATGTAASFYYPYGVAVDASGNVFVADTSNGLIRKITPGGVATTVAGTYGQGGVKLGPLPGSLAVTHKVAVRSGQLYFTTANSVLKCPAP